MLFMLYLMANRLGDITICFPNTNIFETTLDCLRHERPSKKILNDDA